MSSVVQEPEFLNQLAAHQKFIEPYKAPNVATNSARIVETPLLIGYFETSFGLGEYARGLASALQAVSLPFAVYPYNGFTYRPRDEAPWASHYDVDNIHAINILSMATDQTRNARRIIGPRQFENSYNILIAPWELPRAPDSWRVDLDLFDELWALSSFVADSFRPIFLKPIMIVPPCIDFEINIAPDRQKLGLDADKFYFLFSFDFNSRPDRKNPAGILKAFALAFGQKDNVGLILKISGAADQYPKEMREIEAASHHDRRITIMRDAWKRADMLALLASVDCYVSLHRSEGFGMGMAESMLLGKPVIGTAYSGNTDFLTAETGYPVPYTLRAVRAGEYPYHEGNSWAEPDVTVAAEIMRAVANKSDEVRKTALSGQAFIRQHYGPRAIGELVASRSRELIAALSSKAKVGTVRT
jgi:glycosyltransferase involved in cell wall biosynthesis